MSDLSLMTWPQIRAAQRKCPLLVLPLGATEQHGPALPAGTDTIIAEALCREACLRAGVTWAPVLPYTSSAGHTTKWPGTFSVTPRTFIDILVQWTRWAVATGWEKILFVNAHAGNAAPLRVAVDQIRLELLGKVQVGSVDTFTMTEEIAALFTRDAADLHANRAECDLLLHLSPASVDRGAFPQSDDPDRTAGKVFCYPVSQTSLNGTTGSPSLGDAGEGAKLFESMVEELRLLLHRAIAEKPPLPPEEWCGVPENFYS
jgi:creatinine amidohydrolase